MLDKFERFNRVVGGWAEWVGFGAVCFMIALTAVDVVGAKLFRLPVPGALDLMMLGQLVAVSFAATMATLLDRHIQVEFFVLFFPKRLQALVDCLVYFLTLGLFILIVWRLFTHAYHQQGGAEETATAHIALAPFTYACALAIAPVCLVLLQRLLTSILKVTKHGS
jgi:TRAP-type C4-dicarboxylate transport system permease small subunit